MSEVVLRLEDGTDARATMEALAAQGINVTQRFGDRYLIASQTVDEHLPIQGVNLVKDPGQVDGAVDGPDLLLRAHSHRLAAELTETPPPDPQATRLWTEGDAPAPPRLVLERSAPAGAVRVESSAAVTLEEPRRLINEVAVGLVFVNAPGDSPYKHSQAEQIDVLSRIQGGLSWLAAQEPRASITWTYEVKTAYVDTTPWKGANWPGLPDAWYKGIDAALMHDDKNQIFLFKQDRCVRYSNVSQGIDKGPTPISEEWPGLPPQFASGIDAALYLPSPKRILFFKGQDIATLDLATKKVTTKSISAGWPGMPSDFNEGIDAALLHHGNGTIHFFKGDRYVRFANPGASAEGPFLIADDWKGVFANGIDAALWRKSDQKMYFFSGQLYVRVADMSDGPIDKHFIGLNWGAIEALWRDPAHAQLGLPTGDEGPLAYAASLKADLGTDAAYVGYLTRWPVGWVAYASFPKIVVDIDFGPANMKGAFIHETAHFFGVPDEYDAPCDCSAVFGRFFAVKNANCKPCTPKFEDCIMAGPVVALCSTTPWHLGWGAFLDKIDAAIWRESNGMTYLFSGGWYARYTDISKGMDEGYPKLIKGQWKGLPSAWAGGIDAAVRRAKGDGVYYFKGKQCAHLSKTTGATVVENIADAWHGLDANFATGIDAALRSEGNGRIYFFKGDRYARIDDETSTMDDGYPRKIAGNWHDVPAPFTKRIDAALMRPGKSMIYLFRGGQYVRVADATKKMDAGYPAWIDRNWMPFPRVRLP
jgi:hypothetical protein